jgi:hypothetical protein
MRKLDTIESIKLLTKDEIETLANDCYDINYNPDDENHDIKAEHIGCVTGIQHLIEIIKRIQ